MHPKIIPLLLLLIISFTPDSNGLQAQRGSAFQRSRALWTGATFFAGYHQSTISSDLAFKRWHDKAITPGFGYTFGISYTTYPLNLEFAFFKSKFAVDDDLLSNIDAEDITVSQTGGEAAANLLLLPNLPAVQPSIGVGYQYASLGINLYDDPEEEEEFRSGIPTHAPIYKLGLNLRFRRVVLNAQYKRSFSNDEQRRFYQFAATFRYQIGQK